MELLQRKKIDFTEFYTNYYQVVYGTIYSKVSNITDADDLTQEVFMHFYSQMDTILNRRSWVFGTINNLLMNYYRKKKRFSSEEDIEHYLADVSLTFVNGFRDTRIIIDEVISLLCETDRLLFDFIAVQNLTYVMAAKHLGMTRRQVEYRYARIVKTIQEKLGERGISKLEDLL
ncbi:MAG: sigma-70 family RNA polymerase sigma factor [Spirochaetes bacterium]|nr:sigma-70 family RNA polymerase sigma factor [Spirochaetota bacterium]